jgi:phage FluMu gp28-like protein
MNKAEKYLLPYQSEWLRDKSQIKIWEKSRRIGATYVQALEDVLDSARGLYPAVWFSSADESAAREYILYCSMWVKVLNYAAQDMGEVILDSDKDIKVYQIKFSNGIRINALSSNPKAFRSKGGKVVWDEAAWHDDQPALWKAAKPTTTWGFPLRILSTHNGQQSLFFKFIDKIKKGKLGWSLHTTTIHKAVEDGLVDKIFGRKTTEVERIKWLKEQEEDAFDSHTWLEEFCCIAVDEATAFLTYELITGCEDDSLNSIYAAEEVESALSKIEGDLYVGYDIGRRKDLAVIWVIEKLGPFKITRLVKVMEKAQFSVQRKVLFSILSHPKFRRAEIDETGLGMQLAEEAQQAFGKYRVEAVYFTGKVKEELAYNLLTSFEDKSVRIPAEHAVREDLHSIRKVTTAANNIRFDVGKSEVSGHADRFWALALCLHAASDNNSGPVVVDSAGSPQTFSLLDKYFDPNSIFY